MEELGRENGGGGLQRLGMSGRLQGLHCLSCPNRQISVRVWKGRDL